METPSTDPTRGEPLAIRARKRRDELAAAIEELPERDLREREDLGVAITAIDRLLTHDLSHASTHLQTELERWLESSKRYLDELAHRHRVTRSY